MCFSVIEKNKKMGLKHLGTLNLTAMDPSGAWADT